MLPVRTAPELAVAVKVTVPLLFPLAPLVIVIQESLLTAVQTQPALEVTLTVPLPAPTPKLALGGASEYEQPLAWLIVKVRPPAVIVPVRAIPLFGAAENVIVPLPLPEPPPLTVIQEALLTAVQAQPFAELMAKLPVPPSAGEFAPVVDKV